MGGRFHEGTGGMSAGEEALAARGKYSRSGGGGGSFAGLNFFTCSAGGGGGGGSEAMGPSEKRRERRTRVRRAKTMGVKT